MYKSPEPVGEMQILATTVSRQRILRDTTGAAWLEALHFVSLWSIAVAQPIFDVLGRSPEFFVAHGARPSDLLGLVFGLCLVGPVCCLLATRLFARLGPRWHGLSVGVIIGALVAAVALAAVKPLGNWDPALSFAVAGICGTLAAVGYLLSSPVRLFLTFLSPAVFVVPTLFLLHPPISSLLSTPDHGSPDAVTFAVTPPVVVVVFDQLPLISLLDRDGQIDGRLYPNFAALSHNATWFRNASAVSDMTDSALPAILTGNYPTPGRLPVLKDHPANLFTLFGSRYRLQVIEPLTRLCPRTLCDTDRSGVADWFASVLSDITVVYLHTVLPDDLAASLPPITQNWKDFVANGSFQGRWNGRRADDRREVLTTFIGSTTADSDDVRPVLYFAHVLLPHEPWLYLPTGQRFTLRRQLIGLRPDGTWVDDQWASALNYQRHLLQVRYADSVLGALVGRLREANVYDDALLVVTSDHGASFRPGLPFRQPTEASFVDIASVPLFIKRPRQRTGSIVTTNIETIDIVPTLAAELGVRPSWDADGINAFALAQTSRPTKVVFFDAARRRLEGPDDLNDALAEGIARKFEIFETGDPSDQPSAGIYNELVGKPVADFPVRPSASVEVIVDFPDLLGDVDHHANFIPAHITGAVVERPDAPATPPLAVALNGVLAAITRAYAFPVDGRRNMWEAIVDPRLLEQGANVLEVFVVRESTDGSIVLEAAYAPEALRPWANMVPEEATDLWGVASSGLYQTEWTAQRPFRWTNGAAHLSVPIDPQAPPSEMAVDVLMTGATPKHLRIIVNGCTLFDATIRGHWAQTLALDECLVESTTMDIDLLSGVHISPNDPRPLGVAVTSVGLNDR